MKYFLDTKIIESIKKVNSDTTGVLKPQMVSIPTIDLISIGIVCEDGREYYAVNSECNTKYANHWVKETILSKIPEYNKSYDDLKGQDGRYSKTIQEIRDEILFFTGQKDVVPQKPIFYAHNASYQWVAFRWIFGMTRNQPLNYPMYCRDLKQTLDELGGGLQNNKNYPKRTNEHNALDDAKWNFELFKFLKVQKEFACCHEDYYC